MYGLKEKPITPEYLYGLQARQILDSDVLFDIERIGELAKEIAANRTPRTDVGFRDSRVEMRDSQMRGFESRASNSLSEDLREDSYFFGLIELDRRPKAKADSDKHIELLEAERLQTYRDNYDLRFFTTEEQTEEICLEAVKRRGRNLAYVEKQTPEICLEAVKNDGKALLYVKEETPEICMAAVKRCGTALEFVEEQTEEICLEAIKHDDMDLLRPIQYVKNQTPKICQAAIKQNPLNLMFIECQTPELCLAAVKQESRALQAVKEQTKEICLEAIKQDAEALQYVKNQTPEICLAAVKQDGNTLRFVKNQTPEIRQAAINQDSSAECFLDESIWEALRREGVYKYFGLFLLSLAVIVWGS